MIAIIAAGSAINAANASLCRGVGKMLGIGMDIHEAGCRMKMKTPYRG